jgi:hypothetical protein
MTSKMWARHPASVILQWYAFAKKDEDGYATLSSLVQYLKQKCGIKSPLFVERISSEQWQDAYGWRLQFHPWKPNRVKLVKDGDCNLKLKKHAVPKLLRTAKNGKGWPHNVFNWRFPIRKKREDRGRKTSPIPSRPPSKSFAVPRLEASEE